MCTSDKYKVSVFSLYAGLPRHFALISLNLYDYLSLCKLRQMLLMSSILSTKWIKKCIFFWPSLKV
uniref:Uncharacterized protein n=1 Tax=Rhizophora mucronata TaxID=61149 RepID=A0A2P2JNL0_RHIMU